MSEMLATGDFEVKLTPAGAPDDPVGLMTLDKTFHGDLKATSAGRMLAVRSASVEGSAGYVAMERVTGMLGAKRGSFALHHSGTMDRGQPTLSVTVVPDSGTDELTGIGGIMDIQVEGGRHSYTFHYRLPG